VSHGQRNERTVRPPRREEDTIRRGRIRKPVHPEFDHRINERIRISPVRVIDEEGEQLGIMETDDARAMARERGLDLVEVAANVRPPVCRIMAYGRFKYEQSKKKSSQKKATPQLKIVQLRPKTDTHDLETKLNRAKKFLENGDRVRIVMRLRGREQAYIPRWVEKLEAIATEFEGEAEVVGRPTAEGRTISMTLQPIAGGSKSGESRAEASG
jgi:translation initiation factor IF-3